MKLTIELIGRLRRFIGPAQLQTTIELCRGEEREFFLQKLHDLDHLLATMPKTYEQDGKGQDAIAYLHYFTPSADFYITERDKETPDEPGQHQAFGQADLGDGPELGYISIVELIRAGAELDYHFRPRTLAEINESQIQKAA